MSEKKREEFTPGPYPDLKEDRTRIGLDDRVQVLSWVIFFVNFACTILGEDIREILPGLPYARIRHRDSSN